MFFGTADAAPLARGRTTMKKIFLMATSALLLSACVTDGIPKLAPIKDADTPCVGDKKGKTDTKLTYKKDDIDMKWKSFVGDDFEFRIVLKPSKRMEGEKVKIIGVSGKLPDSEGGGSTSPAWLNIEKSYKELEDGGMRKPALVLCVPPEIPEGTEYKFDVFIAPIGTLDPRVEVKN